MRKEKISHVIGELDGKIIEEAATFKRKNTVIFMRQKWVGIAACFALVAAIGGIFGPGLLPKAPLVTDGIVERNYKAGVTTTNRAIVWPWTYKTAEEKFTSLTVNSEKFTSLHGKISNSLVGALIGSFEAKGWDIYENNKEYTDVFEVYQIENVSPRCRVAVKIEDAYYVYANADAVKPSTLDGLMDACGLPQTVTLNRFSSYENAAKKGDYRLIEDAFLWQILLQCKDAPLTDGVITQPPATAVPSGANQTTGYDAGLPHATQFNLNGNRLSFTVTSEALGIYKRVLSITQDGYLYTNIADYGYTFHIGEEKAIQIISAAKAHANKTEEEPYLYQLIGKLTEIGDGYVLLDDTAMCVRKKDGRVFRVLTNDPHIRRCFSFDGYDINVGDTVIISFYEPITVTDGNTVDGAVHVEKGYLTENGHVLSLE